MLPHIKDHRDVFTVVVRSQSYTFNSSHPEYANLVNAVKNGDQEQFVENWNTAKTIEDWSCGDFRIGNGILWYQDEAVNDTVAERIIQMIREGFDHMPMLRFLENVYKNPSYRAVQELYSFLTHKYLPITEDGHFLAYKAVNNNFLDKHTKTIDNSVGQVVSMPRYRVDDNCNQGCGAGLHVGAIEYVRYYGGSGDRVVICKVNPADVVSVPLDSEQQKVRCCRYEVVAEYEGEILEAVKDFDNKSDEEYEEYDDDSNSEVTEMW
jgi:hypothetical protein